MGTIHPFGEKNSPGSSVKRSSPRQRDFGRRSTDSTTLAGKLQLLAIHDPNELRIIEDIVDKRLARKKIKGAIR